MCFFFVLFSDSLDSVFVVSYAFAFRFLLCLFAAGNTTANVG